MLVLGAHGVGEAWWRTLQSSSQQQVCGGARFALTTELFHQMFKPELDLLVEQGGGSPQRLPLETHGGACLFVREGAALLQLHQKDGSQLMAAWLGVFGLTHNNLPTDMKEALIWFGDHRHPGVETHGSRQASHGQQTMDI